MKECDTFSTSKTKFSPVSLSLFAPALPSPRLINERRMNGDCATCRRTPLRHRDYHFLAARYISCFSTLSFFFFFSSDIPARREELREPSGAILRCAVIFRRPRDVDDRETSSRRRRCGNTFREYRRHTYLRF